ncbi:MAG: dihydroorotate dehydrogenase (quinone) [Opitutae bacterium]|nr:dihydroorotate dehydrogenase (quinone) [Opitutae bacterium]MEC8420405.1 quinone-dependent dihydroorotate dehydrogenase [Verrucomicrobiota bacterium]
MGFLYKSLIKPVFFQMDPETAHSIAVFVLRHMDNSKLAKSFLGLFGNNYSPVSAFGLEFPNPVGLAAGFDKNGQFPSIISKLGFGHVEIGTVTPKPQPGNPGPRLFRIPQEESLVNSLGFNNLGADAMLLNIKKSYPKGKRSSPLGINIGKAKSTNIENAIQDYEYSFKTLAPVADYFTLNISSPNTKNLRQLQKKEHLKPLLQKLNFLKKEWSLKTKSSPIPLLIKISPDESYNELESIVENAVENDISGIIATNTTKYSLSKNQHQFSGGLSGRKLEKKSVETIKFISKLTNGMFPIIGVGGVSDVDSMQRKLDLGACMVQLYTSLIYEGPFMARKLISELKNRNSWNPNGTNISSF